MEDPSGHPRFDVAVVPDFSPEQSRRFEILTLLFLASWLKSSEKNRDLPLHLVCIGEPPDTVRNLGKRARAQITVHEPHRYGGFANKLRGFEIEPLTDHLLLLDADMLVMGNLTPLAGILGESTVSAAVSNGPCLVPPQKNRELYKILNLQYPTESCPPLDIALDTNFSENFAETTEFPPFYNGGIVFSPWDSNLGQTWGSHLETLRELTVKRARRSNQPSLATSIAAVRERGYDFRLLPDAYHARWQHVAAGILKTADIKLLHTCGFGRWSSKGNNNTSRQEIDIYQQNTLRLTRELKNHKSKFKQWLHARTMKPQLAQFRRIHDFMDTLYIETVKDLKP